MPSQHNFSADGLRGLASLNVAISHFVAAFLPMMLYHHYPVVFPENKNPSIWFEIASHPLISIFFNGHFAVMVFFVLSGYVLTLPYWSGGVAVIRKRFWGRYLRLNLPIAVSITISYLVWKNGLYMNVIAADLSGSTWLKNYFSFDNLELSDVAKTAVYGAIAQSNVLLNPPLWSLKIEFIGSLLLLGFYGLKPVGRDVTWLLGISLLG